MRVPAPARASRRSASARRCARSRPRPRTPPRVGAPPPRAESRSGRGARAHRRAGARPFFANGAAWYRTRPFVVTSASPPERGRGYSCSSPLQMRSAIREDVRDRPRLPTGPVLHVRCDTRHGVRIRSRRQRGVEWHRLSWAKAETTSALFPWNRWGPFRCEIADYTRCLLGQQQRGVVGGVLVAACTSVRTGLRAGLERRQVHLRQRRPTGGRPVGTRVPARSSR